MFIHGLRDLGCFRSSFTWSRGGLYQRLDRAISNGEWDLRFSNCSIRNLHRLKSDHHPIFVSLDCSRPAVQRPFATWIVGCYIGIFIL